MLATCDSLLIAHFPLLKINENALIISKKKIYLADKAFIVFLWLKIQTYNGNHSRKS